MLVPPERPMNQTSEGPVFIVLVALGVAMTLLVVGGMLAFLRIARRDQRKAREQREAIARRQ